ncbi:MAG: iron-containing alcohol dehydrogenase [Bacteroidales bacterium]|nr:iron-containing alcohol dehydrogenase [Bacteroidales bacterium]MBN2821020.1 iron-containing alcohol dehydrogenase [Bacteroidales bacterium]
MKSFSLTLPGKIVFGSGTRKQLPDFINNYGENALIITGKSFLKRDNIGKELFQLVKEKSIQIFHEIIDKEPSPADVDTITAWHRNNSVNIVVAIGGGSVIDAGKAVSAMLKLNDSVTNYLEGVGSKTHCGIKIPFIALPTTSGTGSESTMNAVITQTGSQAFKKSLRHENLVPDIALVDPEFTLNCPPEITASTGMDAFTQLVEAYLSVKASPMTDALAIDGIKAIVRSLNRVYKDGYDLKAREDIAYAAMLSGICLANAGLGVVHGFAQPLGSLFPIPHGVVCGTLMAAANRITIAKIKDHQSAAYIKYQKLASLVTDKDSIDKCNPVDFVNYLEELSEIFSFPKLSAYGIVEDDFNQIVAGTGNKNHPIALTYHDKMQILLQNL